MDIDFIDNFLKQSQTDNLNVNKRCFPEKDAKNFGLFEADIVPSCNSTIFLTIFSPKPECFPKLLGLLL